ncbi:DUF928 domain-containing protein [Baaleninema simplex]|uniref:DUF928 domain-containing protein n=1 Tax=Baaleninema simplex TaxID=2862350 RepID=UPI00034ABE15|nr:DUF928 domain-containing protein [Baaleninema simplex]
MFRSLRFLVLAGIALSALVLTGLFAIAPARSLDFTPPDRGAPERVDAGGTRYADFEIPGDRDVTIVVNGEELECPLTAILPPENYGLTLRDYPTIYVHVPNLPGADLQFTLRDDNDEVLYQSRFRLGHRHGTFGIPLPDNANFDPLELYRSYRWTVELLDFGESISGAIVKVSPTEEFQRQLDRATSEERLELYAETGIWYDAIDTLATLHRNDPDNSQWMEVWREITESVDLMKVGNKPLL